MTALFETCTRKVTTMVALVIAFLFTPYWAGAQGCWTVGCRTFAQSAGTAIAMDAHCSNLTGAGTTVSCTLTGVQAGDLLTAEVTERNGFLTAIGDTSNGGWTQTVTDTNTAINPGYNGIFYLPNSAAGNPVVTITLSGSEWANLSVQAWRNAATTSPLDTAFSPYFTLNQTTPEANPACGSSVTPSSANELIIGYLLPSTTTPTAGTNFTLTDVTSNGFNSAFPEYWVQTTATATTVPFVNTADYSLVTCAAFKHS